MLCEQESIELVLLTFPFAFLIVYNSLEARKNWRQEAAMWRQQKKAFVADNSVLIMR